MKPMSPAGRILDVDVVRGLAVLGMVIWDFRSDSMGNFQVGGAADRFVSRIIAASDIENTVHLIFALLFGWGLAQALDQGATNARRLVSLFLLGMATAWLLDRTDFLHYLAVMGGVLLLFKSLSNRAVLFWAVVMVAAPVLGRRILTGLLSDEAYAGPHLWASLAGPFIVSATYGELVMTRARETMQDLYHPREYIENLDMLVVFLLGLWAARRGVFRDVAGNLHVIWTVLGISAVVHGLGLAWSLALRHPEMAGQFVSGWIIKAPHTANLLVVEYSKQALAVFYVCLVLLLLRMQVWRALLRPCADVGRLALSAYLLHCFIGTTLFFGYGFGLYGRLGMAGGVAVAAAASAAIMVISSWWLSRFELGPAEWAWRTVTYWKAQPFRRPPSAPSGSA